MIAFSYALSLREGKLGTPERPISDLGLVSYRSYWVYAMLEILQKHRGSISVQELSEMLNFRTDDIVKTLQAANPYPYPYPYPCPYPDQAFNMINHFGPTPTPTPTPEPYL